MFSILYIIINTSTKLMSGVEIMSGVQSRKWVHQKPTNQPTNQSSLGKKTCLYALNYSICFLISVIPCY